MKNTQRKPNPLRKIFFVTMAISFVTIIPLITFAIIFVSFTKDTTGQPNANELIQGNIIVLIFAILSALVCFIIGSVFFIMASNETNKIKKNL